jgi:hypothetical protein
LRARTGGEPHQASLDAALLRPNHLPLGARQSGSPRPAHRRLLADAQRS